MRQSISDADLRQDLAEFFERADDLMEDINHLMRNFNLQTGPHAQVLYSVKTLARVRDSIDCALKLIPPNDHSCQSQDISGGQG